MKNKMGFTILEILAVIVIIATITAIAVPSIFKITNKAKDRLYCSKLEIVQKSAERYADDNSLDNTCEIDGTEYNCENITIQDLINGNYIDADGVDGAFLDPRDKLAINTTGVVVYEKNSRNYAYIEDDDCPSLITNILTPTELTNVKHSLTVALGGGSWNGTSPVSLKEGSTLFVNDPSKSGYEFTGWSLSGTGSTLNGNTFTMGTANATLTANWLAGERTLTVNTNGGVWSGTTPQSVLVGNSVTINNPTKAGYAFLGWTLTGTGSTINGTTFTMGDGNTTLSANWTTTTPYTFAYTGGSQSFTAPAAGYYNIELWGAQSGNSGTSYGGYTSGYLYMAQGATYYIYVGGIGNGGCVTGAGGGYNGGGNSGTTGCSRGGGGATDIRLVGGAWNDTTGLNSRIMVAAGGGSGENNIGGAGGGLIGGPNNAGSYSTQISGSAFGYAPTPGGDASGAGGGYYGGVLATGDGVAAGGGSSFISGFAGVSAIASSSSTAATYNTKHYSNNYFLNSSMTSGANSGNGSAKITYVSVAAPIRINTSLNNVRYIKDCINGSSYSATNYWAELQAIYNGINIAKGKSYILYNVATSANVAITNSVVGTDGHFTTGPNGTYFRGDSVNSGNQCMIVDLGQIYNLDEIAVWHNWMEATNFIPYSNVTYVSSDNTNWTTVIATSTVETSQGKRANAYNINYMYTGSVQTFTAPATGYYNIELWGASGGNSRYYLNGTGAVVTGGIGAYTKGAVLLNAGAIMYIYVGGKGQDGGYLNGVQALGGYNGGGNGKLGSTSEQNSGGGGGATDIRITTGAWDDITSLRSRIMVAAGGAGASNWDGAVSGGNGGGLSGAPGRLNVGSVSHPLAGGGTQLAGGTAGGSVAGSPGTFGSGGAAQPGHGSGGGGGYYGGGGSGYIGSGVSSGGGGSSFISGYTGCVAVASSSSTSPRTGTSGATCSQGGTDNLCSIHYSGKYFINGAMVTGANVGNGYAKIAYIGS